MILSTDTQITDSLLLEISQQENIDCVCSYVKKLLEQPKYNFRIFEWTARIENGKIVRVDTTLLNYYDFYNPYFGAADKPNYYRGRVKIMRFSGKLRNDQFIEFEVYDQLSKKSSKHADQEDYLTN